MRRSHRRRNPTGTLLVNPRGGTLSKLLHKLTGGKTRKHRKAGARAHRNPLLANPSKRIRVKGYSRKGGVRVKGYTRRNPLLANPLLANPKRKHSKGRKHGHRRNMLLANPLLANPGRKHGHRRSRRNPLLANPIHIRRRRNPKGFLDGLMRTMQSAAKKVPVAGGVIAALLGVTGSVVAGAAGVMPIAYIMPYVGKYIPDVVKPFGYSIGGAVLSVIVRALPVAVPYKAQLATGLAFAGGAVDAYRWKHGASKDLAGDMAGGMGDEDLDLGEAMDELGIDDDGSPLAAIEWADADLADAELAGDDLSADEIAAAALGRRHYYATYGDLSDLSGDADLGLRSGWLRLRTKSIHPHPTPQGQGQGQQTPEGSPHAGKEGRRWGWLIFWIGMDNFQKLSALPEGERKQAVEHMRREARLAARRLITTHSNTSTTMEQAEMAGLLVGAA